MSAISLTRLYEELAGKLGKDTAENLTNYFETRIDTGLETKSQILATKEGLQLVKEDLQKEISRLDVKISDTKSEIIRWMFIFWASQIAATLCIIFIK